MRLVRSLLDASGPKACHIPNTQPSILTRGFRGHVRSTEVSGQCHMLQRLNTIKPSSIETWNLRQELDRAKYPFLDQVRRGGRLRPRASVWK